MSVIRWYKLFSLWLRNGCDPVDINRFQRHAGKVIFSAAQLEFACKENTINLPGPLDKETKTLLFELIYKDNFTTVTWRGICFLKNNDYKRQINILLSIELKSIVLTYIYNILCRLYGVKYNWSWKTWNHKFKFLWITC